MKRTGIILATILAVSPLFAAVAAEPKTEVAAESNTDVAAAPKPSEQLEPSAPKLSEQAVLKTEVASAPKTEESAVAVKQRFLPMRNRVDREINKHTFAYKGEVMLGATVSYGTLSSEDTDMYLVLDNLKLKGTMVTVNPFIGYFVADNHVIGLRFGYSHIDGSLGNITLDLGEKNDIEMSLGNMKYSGDNYSFGIYHRSYVALDAKGRFGLFSELELLAVTGSQMFRYKSGDEWKETDSDILRVKLNFNPGLAVYIFPNVCGTVSFGLGGLQYNSVKQYDGAGEKIGSRTTSKMQFRLNIADIRVGMTLHLWNRKKP